MLFLQRAYHLGLLQAERRGRYHRRGRPHAERLASEASRDGAVDRAQTEVEVRAAKGIAASRGWSPHFPSVMFRR